MCELTSWVGVPTETLNADQPDQPLVPLVMRAVGRRVAELRQAACLRQQDLAIKMNCAVECVRRIVAGKQNFTLYTLLSLCGALGVEPTTLFTISASPGAGRRGRPRKAEPGVDGEQKPAFTKWSDLRESCASNHARLCGREVMLPTILCDSSNLQCAQLPPGVGIRL